MTWYSRDTIGTQGRMGGIILRDEQYMFGRTSVTLELDGSHTNFYGAYLILCEAPFLLHEHYCSSEQEAQERFDQIKPVIEKLALLVPNDDAWHEATDAELQEIKKQGKMLVEQFIAIFP